MQSPRIAIAAVLCVGLAVGTGGCGGHSRVPRTRAGTLSIYTSLPFNGPYANDARSIYDAEQLALSQAGDTVNGFHVRLRLLNDASSGTGQTDPTTITVNARIAASDPSTIAYIGELSPGSSPYAIPVLSSAGILQVSPGDTATGVSGTTFARVVPRDSLQALAQLAVMRKQDVKRLFIVKDRSTYGADITAATVRNAASYGIDVVDPRGRYLGSSTESLVRAIGRSNAGALLYAGGPGAGVTTLWNALSTVEGTIRKFGSADITNAASWSQTTLAARENTYLSAPGLARQELPRAGSQFVADFQSRYGTRVSWANGIFGYVAMSGVLDALYGLGPPARNQRERLLSSFLGTRALPSALGSYDIIGGQTTFDGYFFTKYDGFGRAESYSP
ncbi:MAG TPA: ABC transporter substrate-binding protein [Solirubrobacteraceae bacterium]